MRSKTSPETLHSMNIASGISMAVGFYASFISASILITPHTKYPPTSFMGWVINHLSAVTPLVPFVAVTLVMLGAALRWDAYLFPALLIGTATFLFWTVVPMIAAANGTILFPTVQGILTYLWFTVISGYGCRIAWRLREPRGGRFS